MNNSPNSSGIARDPEFERLVRAKRSLSLRLTLLIFAVYFGYMALLGFAPDVLGRKIGAASLGIPLGIGLIIFTWLLTGIYVRWANGAYDAMVARLKQQDKQ